jgi:hypothetical protein
VSPGSGIDLATPLRFTHAANLPFSDRGTGITFEPATRFAHVSNEPIQALGSGIVLDRPLARSHAIGSVVLDDKVTTAGYQGSPTPDLWFGGPELSTSSPSFGRMVSVREGSIVLKDASGLVVDSLNYGALVDPWAAKGYQAESGPKNGGCYAPSPQAGAGFGPAAPAVALNQSIGRFPDGADTDSNCADFVVQAATILPIGSPAGSTTIKVANVSGFRPGDKILIDSGANLERALITSVGTAGATTTGKDVDAGSASIPVRSAYGLEPGQTVTVDSGANAETVLIASIRRFNGLSLVVAAPLQHAHAADSQVSGTGLVLSAPLTRTHSSGASVAVNFPTPGAPNGPGQENARSAAR